MLVRTGSDVSKTTTKSTSQQKQQWISDGGNLKGETSFREVKRLTVRFVESAEGGREGGREGMNVSPSLCDARGEDGSVTDCVSFFVSSEQAEWLLHLIMKRHC